jgi:hypothetical protein
VVNNQSNVSQTTPLTLPAKMLKMSTDTDSPTSGVTFTLGTPSLALQRSRVSAQQHTMSPRLSHCGAAMLLHSGQILGLTFCQLDSVMRHDPCQMLAP